MHILIRLAKNIYSYKGVGFLTKLGSFIVCLTALKTFFSYVLLENLKLGRREEEIGGGDIDWGLSTLYFLTKGDIFQVKKSPVTISTLCWVATYFMISTRTYLCIGCDTSTIKLVQLALVFVKTQFSFLTTC